MAEYDRVNRGVGNLPVEAVELVGRQKELTELVRRLGRQRLVTLCGVGGVGKTRLARRAAAEVQPGVRDGVWWVELSSLKDGSMLAYPIAEALPLVDQSTDPMLAVVGSYLAERELLLVLDTCEHVVAECAEVVSRLLAAAPGLRVLATSRRPLELPEEDVVTLDVLPQDDAVTLLAERAGAAVTAADGCEAARLCRRLEGLPLAIELAAARLSQMPLADLNRRLADRDRYAVLGDTEQFVDDAEPPWHQALRTAIGWSHQLSTPAERLAWARLSVFAGSFDTRAAGEVLADEHLTAAEVPRLLAALVQNSIVEWTPTGAGERYRMLDTIREYGAHWLHTLGEEQELRHRHRRYYRTLVQQADAAWMGPEQIAWYDRTVAEHANLRAALDFCLAEGDGHTALEMGGALWFFWFACGFARDGRHYLDQALTLHQVPGPVRAKGLWACGVAAIAQGDTETSHRLAAAFRAALADGADGTDETDETELFAAAYLEGGSLTVSGHQTRAAEALDAAAPHVRPSAGRYAAAWFLARAARAFVHVHLGQFADAAAVADDLRAECARRGETYAHAWGDYMRALAALGLGRADEAAAHARTALEGKRRLHDSLGIAMSIDLLASAAVASGRAGQAARLLGTSEQVWRTLGTPQMGMPELVAARKACEDQARGLLGDDAYDTAYRSGYDSDSDTGIAEALRLSAE